MEKKMGLKELLKSLELPQDITRRGFLKATSMAAVLTMVNEARAKQGVRPYIVLETAKGVLIADPNLCVACHRCELACTEFNEGKASPRLARIKVTRNVFFGPEGTQSLPMTQGVWAVHRQVAHRDAAVRDFEVVEEDGQAWLCWGNGTCFLARLKPNMTELDGDIAVVDLPEYVEGPWLHVRNGIYYLTYASMGEGRENIAYATASGMEGPWTYRGELTGMAENSFTIHPAIVEFKGKWYLFYHNAALTLDGRAGAIGRRSVCVDELHYNEDGTMQYVEQTKGN